MALRQSSENDRECGRLDGYGLHFDLFGPFAFRVGQAPAEKWCVVFVPSVDSSKGRQVRSDALTNVCMVMLLARVDMRSQLASWRLPKHASKLSEAWSGPRSHLHQPCNTQNPPSSSFSIAGFIISAPEVTL